MPPRTSAPRRRTAPAPSPFRPSPSVLNHETRNSIAHHGSSITILWVLMVCMSIAVWMVLLVTMVRLDQLEATLAASLRQQASLQQAVAPAPDSLAMLLAKQATSTSAMNSLVTSASVSPSGALDRGTMSADGTRYAGYEDSITRKIGIGVELVTEKQVKHIVIFDTRSESTGKGTPSEGEMSVRWKSADTIEYDVLVKKGGNWVKETQTVKIFF